MNTTTSPFIITSWQEYLMNFGFRMELEAANKLVFTKEETQLYQVNDVLIVRRWQEGDDTKSAGFREEQKINHISALDETQWWFLLDALDVIRIKDFVRMAQSEDKIDMFVNIGF